MPDAFAAASTYQRIADGGMNIGLVLGKSFPAEEMRNRDLAGTHVALLRNGEVGVEGSGAAVLGDPVNSLCFLANALGRTGGSLAAVRPSPAPPFVASVSRQSPPGRPSHHLHVQGMIVTTGACCILGALPGAAPGVGPPFKDGDTIVARFDGFGDVTLRLQSPHLGKL